ncbi:MAG: 3-dehydroquinate synthase [Desulfuromonas sp.]|nr:MAG: 3-dehydroquinate synthase [Desulfuromonas sp.]
MLDNFDSIKVGLGDKSYPIYIGSGTINSLPEFLTEVRFPSNITIISNETVYALHGETLHSVLDNVGLSVSVITIEDGEEFKNMSTLMSIYDGLVQNNTDRSSGIIALGGGVVGDIAGLAAATFLRGIDYLQIPTTLLAQVDSSVGGKTAVNHSLGKNLIGTFNQPKLVCIDIDFLDTLPEREFLAGVAEIIKYGIIRDLSFFNWMNDNRQALLAKEPNAVVHAVKTSCQIKADIVEIDEKESSIMAILNYGHTFGHAVESLTDYREFLHGEAVAIGMVVAARCSHLTGYCTIETVKDIREIIKAYKLPVTIPGFSVEQYLEAMMHDKKMKNGRLNMVLNKDIGNCVVEEIADPASLFNDIIGKVELNSV